MAVGLGVNSNNKTKMGRGVFYRGTFRPHLEAPTLGSVGCMHSFSFSLCFSLLICDCVHMDLCMTGPRLGMR